MSRMQLLSTRYLSSIPPFALVLCAFALALPAHAAELKECVVDYLSGRGKEPLTVTSTAKKARRAPVVKTILNADELAARPFKSYLKEAPARIRSGEMNQLFADVNVLVDDMIKYNEELVKGGILNSPQDKINLTVLRGFRVHNDFDWFNATIKRSMAKIGTENPSLGDLTQTLISGFDKNYGSTIKRKLEAATPIGRLRAAAIWTKLLLSNRAVTQVGNLAVGTAALVLSRRVEPYVSVMSRYVAHEARTLLGRKPAAEVFQEHRVDYEDLVKQLTTISDHFSKVGNESQDDATATRLLSENRQELEKVARSFRSHGMPTFFPDNVRNALPDANASADPADYAAQLAARALWKAFVQDGQQPVLQISDDDIRRAGGPAAFNHALIESTRGLQSTFTALGIFLEESTQQPDAGSSKTRVQDEPSYSKSLKKAVKHKNLQKQVQGQ